MNMSSLILLSVLGCRDEDVDDTGLDGGTDGGTDGGSDGGATDGGSEEAAPWILPRPLSITRASDPLILTEHTRIVAGTEAQATAELLAAALRPATGYPFPVVDAEPVDGDIRLDLEPSLGLPAEGYSVSVDESRALLEASDEAGLFYASQTFLQLIPTEIFSPDPITGTVWSAQGVQIQDAPRFPWRGGMIDVARHFFDAAAIERQIDVMALHKLNRLHLHLTDDQGWRIEIESWPDLAIIGGASEVGGGAGGHYSQEEFTGLVEYAAARHVTIVPEIDFPGHANAALASYGELNAGGAPIDPYTGAGVISTGLWLDGEETWPMVQDVWTEVAALSPSPYVHIGGDEAIDIVPADYRAFIEDLHGFVADQGKITIGWDEIATAGVEPPFVAQYWLDEDNARMAVADGGQIIASPAWNTYLDMVYDSEAEYGQVWAGMIDIETAYDWEPVLDGWEEGDVLGVEGPLWTEYIDTEDKMDFMLWPRLSAHAEVGWTAAEQRAWPDFSQRLRVHGERLRFLGVGFYESPEMDW